MKKLLYISVLALALASCSKEEDKNFTPSPYNATYQSTLNVKLPAYYDEEGVDIELPKETVLSVLGITEAQFDAGVGSIIKVGYTLQENFPYQTDFPNAVYWDNVEWFDKDGKAGTVVTKVLNISRKYGMTYNVNLIESCFDGETKNYKATLVFQYTSDDKGLRSYFVTFKVSNEKIYDLGKDSTSFSMQTGIVSGVSLAVKDSTRTYNRFEINLPETVYSTLKALQGQYDNFAYFLTSDQIKAYAFPKGGGVGSLINSTNNWTAYFDAEGNEATAAEHAVSLTLDCEAGNPGAGGGKWVKIVVDEVPGTLKAGDAFRCGFVFVYGKTTIPLTVLITVVDDEK